MNYLQYQKTKIKLDKIKGGNLLSHKRILIIIATTIMVSLFALLTFLFTSERTLCAKNRDEDIVSASSLDNHPNFVPATPDNNKIVDISQKDTYTALPVEYDDNNNVIEGDSMNKAWKPNRK